MAHRVQRRVADGTSLAPRVGMEESLDELGPEQGGGPPAGSAWTLMVPDEKWSADLEHAAPVPRVGDMIEYIAADGARRYFVVRQVTHTLQPAASERPAVHHEERGPNTLVRDDPDPGPPRTLRAGLPRVIVDVADTE